ncbi:inner membrane CreD family protein, partial [Pseudomonas aeruginosa]
PQPRTELHYRGIYKAPLYHRDNKVAGSIKAPEHYGIEEGLENYQFETPCLGMDIGDVHGIENGLGPSFIASQDQFDPGYRLC